ncbi:MAG TPA: S41 family peptidase [Steroidobacteraceae bacterium]|nr:S41 family peptidase [Steroidobacteraceae bacterium]
MRTHARFRVLLLPILGALASCGGGGGGGGGNPGGGFGGGNGSWQAGVFKPSANFDQMCVNPRPGTMDRPGTRTDENNWLRSWTNEFYLWYDEVTDRDPSQYSTLQYFDLLKTNATTTSGQPKDKFHFTYDTDVWEALSEGGTEAGYGAEFAILAPFPPRRIVVAFTDPGTPAAAQLQRGDEILQVDGQDAVNGNTQAIVDVLNDGLFPAATGQNHSFLVKDTTGATRTVNLTSQNITHVPVPIATTLSSASGPVGYIQFNDHIATAEAQLITAINTVKNAGATDLILDLRYNGGGYLDMASETAYMIANTTLTAGRTFEKIVFNDKYPTRNPITDELLTPTPFHDKTLGFVAPGQPGYVTPGQALPTLNLDRVYIITGPGTCSASESIINSLRGVNVEVYIIGSTTCGKPYGFYPTDNCGTTYFSIQFRGENAANFGDYSDGFSPANTPAGSRGTSVPGCSVADDFEHPMGDAGEGRIAAALAFRASNNQTCPAASGSSGPPRVMKMSNGFNGEFGLAVSKPAARSNRILRY